MRYTIDLNCDVGESYGRYRIGNDEELLPLISSCNIACGWHGGDATTILNTLALAARHGLRIGAHPSYPDLAGFGRRYMQLSREDLSAGIHYQIAVVKGIAQSKGVSLSYVKPHGALYNRIAQDPAEAETVYAAIAEFDPNLSVMGLAGSHCAKIASKFELNFIAEAFADRRYDDSGKLVARSHPAGVITDPIAAANQAVDIVLGELKSLNGQPIALNADSICIHGDNPNAVDVVRKVRAALAGHQIRIGYD